MYTETSSVDEEKEATMGCARFVDFGKEVKGWDAGFGIEEKGCHPWIGLGAGRGGLAVVKEWNRVWVGHKSVD